MPTKKQAQQRRMAASCRSKRTYPSQDAAQKRAGWLHTKGVRLKPYKCSICSKWHLCSRDKTAVLIDLFEQIERERGAHV